MTERDAGPASFIDEGSWRIHDDDVVARDPLRWPGYGEALARARARSASTESVVAGTATIAGRDVEVALFDFSFMGGSMGEAAGERVARAMERAASRGVPFVLRTATGGARMQEGMVSLAQMAKLVSARSVLAQAHQVFIVVLGDPTTGGVLAGVAALADFTIAEAGATIGFAGPRIARHVTGKAPGESSHTTTAALAAGLVDEVVPPEAVKETLGGLLDALGPDEPSAVEAPRPPTRTGDRDAWGIVEALRASDRIEVAALTESAFPIAFPMCGDRAGTMGRGLGALTRVGGRRAILVTTDGRHHLRPGDYRRVRRCVEVAARLELPVVILIDTPGADPSEGSENAGIAWEVARTFDALLGAPVPILSIITGEGGSGGALALAVGDALVMFDDAFFSVIAPELAAEILWRDPAEAPAAAGHLKITATDLARLDIVDDVVAGPADPGILNAVVAYHLARLMDEAASPAERIERRRERWRTYGEATEAGA